uniref:SH2 domain-containing protein n=1 Tax=Echinostoma caproni TaxID=27848 RepID=A0A183BBL5_9TREM
LGMNPYNRGCCVNWWRVFCSAENPILIRERSGPSNPSNFELAGNGERSLVYRVNPGPNVAHYTSNQHASETGIQPPTSIPVTSLPGAPIPVINDSLNGLRLATVTGQMPQTTAHFASADPISLTSKSMAETSTEQPPNSTDTTRSTTVSPGHPTDYGKLGVTDTEIAASLPTDGSGHPQSIIPLTKEKGKKSGIPREEPLQSFQSTNTMSGPGIQATHFSNASSMSTGRMDPRSGYYSIAGDQTTPLLANHSGMDRVVSGRQFKKQPSSFQLTNESQPIYSQAHRDSLGPNTTFTPRPPSHGLPLQAYGLGRSSSRDLSQVMGLSEASKQIKMIPPYPSASLSNLREKSHASAPMPYLSVLTDSGSIPSSTGDRQAAHRVMLTDPYASKPKLQPPSPKTRSRSAGAFPLPEIPDHRANPVSGKSYGTPQLVPLPSNISLKTTGRSVIGDPRRPTNQTIAPYQAGLPVSMGHVVMQKPVTSRTGQSTNQNPSIQMPHGQSQDTNIATSWPPVVPPHGPTDYRSLRIMASSLYDDLDVLDGTPLDQTESNASAPLVGLRVAQNWNSGDSTTPALYGPGATSSTANTR